jgi:hypothetical protein
MLPRAQLPGSSLAVHDAKRLLLATDYSRQGDASAERGPGEKALRADVHPEDHDATARFTFTLAFPMLVATTVARCSYRLAGGTNSAPSAAESSKTSPSLGLDSDAPCLR